MDQIGRKFGATEDYENLRVNGADLYWGGKKLSTEGWSVGEKLTLSGIVVGVVLALLTAANLTLINWDKWSSSVCGMYEFGFCDTESTENPQVRPEEQADPG